MEFCLRQNQHAHHLREPCRQAPKDIPGGGGLGMQGTS